MERMQAWEHGMIGSSHPQRCAGPGQILCDTTIQAAIAYENSKHHTRRLYQRVPLSTDSCFIFHLFNLWKAVPDYCNDQASTR
jgi:hypothetical protein